MPDPSQETIQIFGMTIQIIGIDNQLSSYIALNVALMTLLY